jgi:hypothetical protein
MLDIWKNLILFMLLYNLINLLLLDRNVLGQGFSGRSDLLFTVGLDHEEGKLCGLGDYFVALFFQDQWSGSSQTYL